MTDTIYLQFDSYDLVAAHDTWGCSCGPASLAAVLNLTLDQVRPAFAAVGFNKERNYTTPTMMQRAIEALGGRRSVNRINFSAPFASFAVHGVCRIQWCGPWTNSGANPKWAYQATHWIASWRKDGGVVVFDCNSGLMPRVEWEREVIPRITGAIPRATGTWYITHSWEVNRKDRV